MSNQANERRIHRFVGEVASKSALVLSAGGMFGAYQAGVWDVLSSAFQPDIVVGASVGSLNAWMIASGCAPEELIGRWRQLEGAGKVRWRWPSRISEGILDCSELEIYIQSMCAEYTPKRELGIVLTELRTFRPRLFRTPDLAWQHIAASCAVPVFLRHHSLEGCWFSDGGLIDPLPVNAALEMGATTLVTVNVLQTRPWLIRGIVRCLQAWSGYQRSEGEGIRIVDISPRCRLGTARDSMLWTPANAEEWIAQGRRDAMAALPALQNLKESRATGTFQV